MIPIESKRFDSNVNQIGKIIFESYQNPSNRNTPPKPINIHLKQVNKYLFLFPKG